jgi:hypothetical protein
MARYSREATMRAVRRGDLPPLVCSACGWRYWTEEQRAKHDGGIKNGVRICYYGVPTPRPIN